MLTFYWYTFYYLLVLAILQSSLIVCVSLWVILVTDHCVWLYSSVSLRLVLFLTSVADHVCLNFRPRLSARKYFWKCAIKWSGPFHLLLGYIIIPAVRATRNDHSLWVLLWLLIWTLPTLSPNIDSLLKLCQLIIILLLLLGWMTIPADFLLCSLLSSVVALCTHLL